MTPDVNALVAAARPDHVHHQVSLDWSQRALEGVPAGHELLLLLATAH